jgi:hypothetical protein
MGEGERRENKEQVQEASCRCSVPDDAGTVNGRGREKRERRAGTRGLLPMFCA